MALLYQKIHQVFVAGNYTVFLGGVNHVHLKHLNNTSLRYTRSRKGIFFRYDWYLLVQSIFQNHTCFLSFMYCFSSFRRSKIFKPSISNCFEGIMYSTLVPGSSSAAPPYMRLSSSIPQKCHFYTSRLFCLPM